MNRNKPSKRRGRSSRRKNRALTLLRLPIYLARAMRVAAVVLPILAVAAAAARLARTLSAIRFSAKDAVDDGKKRVVIAFRDVLVQNGSGLKSALARRDIVVNGSVKTAVAGHNISAGDPDIKHQVARRVKLEPAEAAGPPASGGDPAEISPV